MSSKDVRLLRDAEDLRSALAVNPDIGMFLDRGGEGTMGAVISRYAAALRRIRALTARVRELEAQPLTRDQDA